MIPGVHPFELREYQPTGELQASHQSASFPLSLPGSRLAVMETGVPDKTVIGPSCPLAFMSGVGKEGVASAANASTEKNSTVTQKYNLISFFIFTTVSFLIQIL
ncbi:MAG: hypothetical protein NTU74_05650 [Deltaproteobacteria bacterium]|nr:hypothetical protein [Deltaproteobacteria bacterium]